MSLHKTIVFLCLIFIFIFVGCSPHAAETNENPEIFVSAAASLTDALEEIKTIYEKENHISITYNFSGSGKLAQQIEQGAPVDLFISANEHWMDQLEQHGMVNQPTRTSVTGNSLVLIAHKASTFPEMSLEDIVNQTFDQIAIGNPESVPAGEYTKEILQRLHIWDSLKDNFVFAKDVRQVLTYVESQNVDIGFVYLSDAMISDQVKVLSEANQQNIAYPGAVMSSSEQQKEAEAFLDFLVSETGQGIFEKYGFKHNQGESK